MKTSVRVSVLAGLALLAFCTIPDGKLDAQSTFGSVRGSTLDQMGAAIPGAHVVLRSLDENTEATTVSDSEGGSRCGSGVSGKVIHGFRSCLF